MTTFVEIEGDRLAELLTDEDSVANPEVAVDDAIALWTILENPREMIDAAAEGGVEVPDGE